MNELLLGKFLLHFRSNMLITDPFITNEIHITIDGDHVGGSFKMSFQVANVEIPTENIILLSSAFLRQKIIVSTSNLLETF